MKFRFLLLFSAIAGLHAPALAETGLSEPIVKAPELTLRDLVPAAILDGISNPFNLQAEVMSNEADQPFQVTFDITMPEYPNVTISLLVSERENVIGLVSRLRSMANAGNLPGGSPADMDAVDGADCIGVVGQNMITCMIGTAGVQFTATDFMEGDSIDYAATKTLFSTLPLENYRKVFGR